jgi:hypothetical protein
MAAILREHSLRDSLTEDVQHVSRLWRKDMRFLPTTKVRTIWYDLGEIGKK